MGADGGVMWALGLQPFLSPCLAAERPAARHGELGLRSQKGPPSEVDSSAKETLGSRTSGLRLICRDRFQTVCWGAISKPPALVPRFQDLIPPAWPASAPRHTRDLAASRLRTARWRRVPWWRPARRARVALTGGVMWGEALREPRRARAAVRAKCSLPRPGCPPHSNEYRRDSTTASRPPLAAQRRGGDWSSGAA